MLASDLTREESDDLYLVMVCYGRPSCAMSLLALWERPWSSHALRWANHVLVRAYNAGCDVLEHNGIKGRIR